MRGKLFEKRLIQEWLIALALLALVALIRTPSIAQPLDNDTGASTYHTRLILQGEPLYSTHHPAHHLPGIYYTYALIFRLLGDDQVSLKLALIPWVWLTAWLLYQIGRRLHSQMAGLLASVFFIFGCSLTAMQGDTAQIELFGNLPLTLGIWLGLELLEKRSRPLVYYLVGLVGGIAFFYKANYLAGLAGVGIMMLVEAGLERTRAAWLVFFQRGLAIAAGLASVFGLVSAYFISQGLWARFFLVFQLGASYVSFNQAKPAIYIALFPITILLAMNTCLFAFGALGLLRLVSRLRTTLRLDRQLGLAHVMLITWLFVSMIETGFSRMSFPHYALLIIPPFALFAGLEISTVWKMIPAASGLRRILWSLLPAAMALSIIGNALYISKDYVLGYFDYLARKISYTEFIYYDTFLGDDRILSLQTAEYLAAHTQPSDYIYLWSDQAQTYYLANRRSSSEIIWPVYVSLMGPPERVFDKRPVYVVLGPIFFKNMNASPSWLTSELAANNQLETAIGPNQLYRRTTP